MTVTVPPGTSSGTKLRLRGKGVRNPKTKERGDQFVVVKIVVPRQTSDAAKKLYRDLAEIEPAAPRSGLVVTSPETRDCLPLGGGLG